MDLESVVLMGSGDCLEEIFLVGCCVIVKVLRAWKKQRDPSNRSTLTTNLSE
jgi:hypothetical protein